MHLQRAYEVEQRNDAGADVLHAEIEHEGANADGEGDEAEDHGIEAFGRIFRCAQAQRPRWATLKISVSAMRDFTSAVVSPLRTNTPVVMMPTASVRRPSTIISTDNNFKPFFTSIILSL